MTRLLIGILIALCASLAQAGVIYSLTFDSILHNDGAGVFGGNLLVGQGQTLNLTLEYTYDERPFIVEPASRFSDGRASFGLLGVQVFDNTNGLASDAFADGGGWLELTYRDSRDRFTGAGRDGADSGLLLPRFPGFGIELGEPGDSLPFGAAFDVLVEQQEITLMATAGSNETLAPGSFLFNYVNQFVGGIDPIQPGAFSFKSRQVPGPATFPLVLLGILLIAQHRRRLRR